jgi:DNA-binding CsgD family transcriptional regulator
MNAAHPTSPDDGGLLERDESLATLQERLDTVRATREGQVILVVGEAGVGKTSLLRRFCDTQPPVTRILSAACAPLRTPRPLGPFLDLSERIGGDVEQMVSAESRPHEVAEALLRELRGRRPVVLVLEDLHWADEATLDVVTLLVSRVTSAPALVLGSYRGEELDTTHPLRVLSGELVRRHGRVRLAPLSPSAVEALARPHGFDGVELYHRTGGNPFFVTEVLAGGGEWVPDTVRDAVLARAARLSEPARRLLEAVAIVPGPVDLQLLETLAPDLIDELDTCLAVGMLIAAHGAVAFRHELARLAIEDSVSPTRMLALHRAALAALAGREGGDPAAIAHHAEACGDAESVLRWAPVAAERAAAAGAHRQAAAQYERALRFAGASSDADRAKLLRSLAHERYMTSRLDEAIVAQQEALDLRGGLEDPFARGDALRALSRLMFFAGRVDEGEAVLSQAVEQLERLPPGRELAMAYAAVSQRQMVLERDDEVKTWGTRALELARRLGDIEIEVYALATWGGLNGDPGDGKLERALTLAREAGLEEHTGRILQLRAHRALRQRMFELAEEPLASGLAFCTERGLDTWRLYLVALRARAELDRGQWDAAAESAAAVLRDPRSASVARNGALVVLGLIRARRGDADALSVLLEAERIAVPTHELMRIAPTAAARAELAWLNGNQAEVAEATEAALALALECNRAWIAGELAYWRMLSGVRDELPPELIAEPYLLALSGDWERASQRWHEIGCPYEAALALADADDDRALLRAHEELQALGARPAAAIVARRLRERGVRGVSRGPRPRTRANPAGLTSRELEVLALVAEGLRNAQIAERLIVSNKTVAHHVSAILRKLGVTTRGEAVAEALRLGL